VSFTIWMLAFASMFALDVCWAIYTDHAAKGRALGAASWAVLLHLLGSATTLAIVDDPRYLTATVIGAFAGTFAGVWWTRRKLPPS
jgi:hypothetical protein